MEQLKNVPSQVRIIYSRLFKPYSLPWNRKFYMERIRIEGARVLYGAWAVLSFHRVFADLRAGAVIVPRTAFLKGVRANSNPLPMKPSKEKELEELEVLLDHIKEIYLGDYACVSRALEKAVYYLHYLEKDVLNPHEIQDTCYELHKLVSCPGVTRDQTYP